MLTGSDVALEDFKFHKNTPRLRDLFMCCNMSHFRKGVEGKKISHCRFDCIDPDPAASKPKHQ